MFKVNPIFLAGLLLFLPDTAHAVGGSPPFAPPVFYFFSTIEASDYRPVHNADATVVIFERTFRDHPKITKVLRWSSRRRITPRRAAQGSR
jgi:hypothetical protein